MEEGEGYVQINEYGRPLPWIKYGRGVSYLIKMKTFEYINTDNVDE